MNGGFGMRKELTQGLISHTNTFHCHRHYSTLPSSAATAAPATLCHCPDLNRNPNPTFPARNRSDLNCYRSGHVDEQGRLLKGSPAITPERNTNVLFGQQETPKLMNLFPAMPSEGLRTLPLLSQLETRRLEDTATEKDEDIISSSIDLTLRL